MGKLKAFWVTGLALFLTGILGVSIGCSKKREAEIKEIPRLSMLVKNNTIFVDDKIELFSYTGYIKQDIEKLEIDTSCGKAFTNFQLGGIAKIKYFSGSDKKMLDSAKIYYQQMLNCLSKDVGNSDMVTDGPLKLYADLFNYAKKPRDLDSIQKYLNLAKSLNTKETPNNVLLSQALISSGLHKNKKEDNMYICDLKNIIQIISFGDENTHTKEHEKMKYMWYLSGEYRKMEEADSGKVYYDSAKKIAKKYGWTRQLKE